MCVCGGGCVWGVCHVCVSHDCVSCVCVVSCMCVLSRRRAMYVCVRAHDTPVCHVCEPCVRVCHVCVVYVRMCVLHHL